MCQYDDVNGGNGSNGSDTGSNNVSNMVCETSSSGHGDPGHVSTSTTPRTGYCNHSWFDLSPWYVKPTWSSYYSRAYARSLAKCQSMGFTRILDSNDFPGSIPQGNPVNDAGQPWAGVKEENHVQGTCCVDPTDCNSNPTGHYYRYCFFCAN
jgi:hypothetical protein